MKPIHIYRPVFGISRRGYLNPQAYTEGLIQHLQETEEWIKMMHTEGGDTPAMCQLWVMEHRDGRVARLPDPCPLARLRQESEEQERQWLQEKLTITFKINNYESEQ